MLLEPEKRISNRALPVWRIYAIFQSVFVFLFCGGAVALAIIYDGPIWVIFIAVAVFVLFLYFFVYLFPLLKWRRWRYDVREQEIELQHGIFIVKRTLVPMIRVQHVDTKQGPILRKYHLATVTVSTAATVHEIPALELEEAEELRVFISQLARVADEDV